jgi:flavin reductase (DIM6/NTAB) family NADH-FMN oxidoreductase RutF
VQKSTAKFCWAKTPAHRLSNTTMTQLVPTAKFVQAMGQHVASVCVITTSIGTERFGLTATAVSSVCADPPRLLVCVNKTGLTYQKIIAAGYFGVSVLSETQDKVGKAFAGMLGRDFDRFSVGDWQSLKTGSPILAAAASAFDCRIVETIDQFTHSICIGEVVAAQSSQGADGLVYANRRFRTLRKATVPQPEEGMESLHF